MTSAQFISADPNLSVWLSASAGTGKTKVLVDRLLRILLRGDAPSSIVCLTYTKAAAMEMQLRIQDKLSQWSAMQEPLLHDSLCQLLGRPPEADEIHRARTLLALLLESADGLNIQTIHAFCQSLLMRFPLEAGLLASPQVMDDRTRMELLAKAQRQLLATASAPSCYPDVKRAVHHLASRMADGSLQNLFSEMAKHHLVLRQITKRVFAENDELALVYKGLGATRSDSAEEIIKRFMHETRGLQQSISAIIAALGTKNKTRQSLAESLSLWQQSEHNLAAFETLSKWFLTADGSPKTRHALCTESFAKDHPADADDLMRLQDAIYDANDQLAAHDVAHFTESVLKVAGYILEFYRDLKAQRGLHDYDDIIDRSLSLLSLSGMSEWVITKLGYRIRHILVDEAQDTAPEQWQLIRLITQELMIPDHSLDNPRSLFVVGDSKQSIFKFQGADPEAFFTMRDYFKQWFEQTGLPFQELSLVQSFRSSKAVLKLVDAVCALPEVASAIGQEQVAHELYRSDGEGKVSLWPVVRVEKPVLLKPWEVMQPNYQPLDASEALAVQVADTVSQWLQSERVLESQQRPLLPGDIMILLRNRAPLASKINRHLMRRGVVVAGADRIALADHLVTQDVLALARWCLLRGDDLTLATVLKGPWFEWSEEALFDLAYNRSDDSLWQRLEDRDRQTHAKLLRIYEQSQTLKPFEWIHFLLFAEGGMDALLAHFGLEAQDTAEELLEQALVFESQHTPLLQYFVAWMETQTFDTKRELTDSTGGVRVMTVHAAKGLEAPVVIVPVLPKHSPKSDMFMFDWYNEKTIAYVMPPYARKPLKIEALKANQQRLVQQEEYRLLYVALTRARDELHIAGGLGQENWPKHSWYEVVKSVIEDNTAFPDHDLSGLDSTAA